MIFRKDDKSIEIEDPINEECCSCDCKVSECCNDIVSFSIDNPILVGGMACVVASSSIIGIGAIKRNKRALIAGGIALSIGLIAIASLIKIEEIE